MQIMSSSGVVCTTSAAINSVVADHPRIFYGSIQTSTTNRFVKCPYRWRWFGKKGVILVLFWNFVALSLLNYALEIYVEKPDNKWRYYLFIGIPVVSIFYPVIGWLTDFYIGRYRVLKGSLVTLLCGIILWCLIYLLYWRSLVSFSIKFSIMVCTGIVVSFGVGSILVNTVQFSIDQLLDSSSEEIISFITWYIWTYFAAQLVATLQLCISSDVSYNFIFSSLYIAFLLTLAVSSDFLLNHWLVKEPVTLNPLKLVFKVLQFAFRNKYPQSSLAYWDSNRCSRIDLAKSKYGGPFTSGHVEDVKAFFRIHGLILIGSLYCAIALYCNNYISPILSKFQGFHQAACSKDFEDCVVKKVVTNLGYVVIILGIPLYEFFLRPVFLKMIPPTKMFTRLAIGTFFMLVHLSGLVSAEVVGHFSDNTTVATESSCKSFESESYNLGCDQGILYYWLSPLSLVYVIGQYLILASGTEYLCAKTPYSMRGLMFGSVFTCLGFSLSFLHVLFILFRNYSLVVLSTDMGCVFWFLVTCCVVVLLFTIALASGNFYYKTRRNLHGSTDDTTL